MTRAEAFATAATATLGHWFTAFLLLLILGAAFVAYRHDRRRERENPYPPPPGMPEWRAKHWLRANREPGQLPDVDDAGRWRR